LGQRFPGDGYIIFLHIEEARRTASSVLFAKHADCFGDCLRVVLVDEVRCVRDAYVLGSRDQRGEALVDTPLKAGGVAATEELRRGLDCSGVRRSEDRKAGTEQRRAMRFRVVHHLLLSRGGDLRVRGIAEDAAREEIDRGTVVALLERLRRWTDRTDTELEERHEYAG
jgi:hypothetical protein